MRHIDLVDGWTNEWTDGCMNEAYNFPPFNILKGSLFLTKHKSVRLVFMAFLGLDYFPILLPKQFPTLYTTFPPYLSLFPKYTLNSPSFVPLFTSCFPL